LHKIKYIKQNFKGGETMKNVVAQSQVEFVRLYEEFAAPVVPWKFVVEWDDYFWPIRWSLCPLADGNLWLVKKESPWNDLVKEEAELWAVVVNGEVAFVEPVWNNEILQTWSPEEVYALFDQVRRGEYSGVVIEENCSEEERKEIEKTLRLLKVIRMMLEDRERIQDYGKLTFGRYVERYYSAWLGEFREFFEELAKLKGEERVRRLEEIKEGLEKWLSQTGYFMYVYYP
jgi:hypothetical protein